MDKILHIPGCHKLSRFCLAIRFIYTVVVLRHEEDTLNLESRNNMLDMIVFIPMQDSAKDDIVPTEKTEKTELEPWNQSWSHLRDHPVTFMCPKWSFLRQWNHGCEEAYCKHACEMEAKRCRVGMIGICDAWDNVKVSKSRISSQMSFAGYWWLVEVSQLSW